MVIYRLIIAFRASIRTIRLFLERTFDFAQVSVGREAVDVEGAAVALTDRLALQLAPHS